MKPFTPQEAEQLRNTFASGSADDVLSAIASVQRMGGTMAKAAMAQLGVDNNVYALAGAMGVETGQMSTASDIVRGQKRIEGNPAIRDQVGADRAQINNAFFDATGGSLLDIDPASRQALQDAALAHYVETTVARGGAGAFDDDAFETSVQSVLGARQGDPSIGTVNGEKTVLPPGISDVEMEEALQNMTVADWAAMSNTNQPPRYVTGDVAQPEDLADEAVLRAIGNSTYRVQVSDGSYLTTGRPGATGRLEAYTISPTAEKVREINERDRAAAEQISRDTQSDLNTAITNAQQDGLSHEEYRAIVKKYGAQAVDEWVRQNQ